MKERRQKPQRKFTKRQLSRWQQQQKRRRRIFLGLGIFIATVLIITGVLWYFNHYQPLHRTVIRVNDASFSMDYYIRTLQFYGEGQPSSDLADEVVTLIQRNELIRQGAAKLGIGISRDMIDEELRSRGLPLSRYSRDIVNSEMLMNKLQDEYFEKEVPIFIEQRHVMAMLLESESQVVEVRTRIEAGEDFGNLAGDHSLEKNSANEDGDLGWHPKGALTVLLGTSVVDEHAFSSEVGTLSEPVHDEEIIKDMGYWIVKVLEREEEAAVRGILLGSEEEAQWVRDKLIDGKDFGELAEALSEHEGSKKLDGYLGSWTPDEVSPAFAEFVFNSEIEIGTVSEPIFDDTIATEGGYWLIEVLERKERANVLGILLGSEEEAQWVKGRLDAGEDFGELAKEFSQHEWSKEAGGDLGWLKRGKENLAFDEFLFDSELETVSEPIRYDTFSTKGGYWLIKVVDKDDNRQVDDSYRYLLKARALEEWIESLWNDPENKIENYLDADKKAWAIQQAIEG